jgi:gliding motility-associated-like protein
MLKNLLLFCLFPLCNFLFAQNEYNIWYFGNKAGISFNTASPTAITDGSLNSIEASSSICDKSGKILFYSNGDTVWNRLHQYMKNGISPIFYDHATSSQGAVIVKKPNSDSLYYIFCPQSDPSREIDHYMRYWLIDMSKDNGLGEAIKINEPLFKEPMEGVAIAQHANDTDFWVGAIDYTTGKFNCMRTRNGELDSIVTTDLGIISSLYFCSKFSPDSKILLSQRDYGPDGYSSFIYLHHFNNETGVLSDKLQILTSGNLNMAMEYSHNSNYLYITNGQGELIQYDLSIWDKNIIEQSASIIYHDPNREIMGMQLGPDKKIYAFHLFTDSLTVINYPWLKSPNSIVKQNDLWLKGRINQYGGPYHPNFLYKELTTDLVYFIPNAFTPNGDKLNDEFGISGQNIEWVKMQIYNRWGEKILDKEGYNPSWDGKFKGNPCESGNYIYSIMFTAHKKGLPFTKEVSGSITLLR